MNIAQRIADITFIILLVLVSVFLIRTERLAWTYKTPYLGLLGLYFVYRFVRRKRKAKTEE